MVNQQCPHVSIPHNHSADQLEVEVLRLKSYLRLRCASENTSMARILNDAELKFSKEAVIAIGGVKSMKPSMYRSRSKGTPQIPQNLRMFAAILEMEKWRERYATELGPNHMTFFKGIVEGDDGSVAVIFGSPTILRYAEQGVQLRLHMDATFKVVPRQGAGSQLFGVYVHYNGTVYPMLYVLMESKKFSAYVAVLRKLKILVPQMKVESVMADYEVALRQAVLIVFPGVQLLGCWFHFAQAVYKRAASTGLTRGDVDDQTRRIWKMAMALPLLPEHLLAQGFRQLQIEAGNRPELESFLTYLQRQWSQANITVYRQPQRTNNAVESVHRDLLRIISREHPNIWLFTECLLRVEHTKSVDFLRSQDAVETPRRPRQKYRRLNEVIQRAQDKLDEDGDVSWFLRRLAHTIRGPQNMFQTGLEHGGETEDITHFLENAVPIIQNIPPNVPHQPPLQPQQQTLQREQREQPQQLTQSQPRTQPQPPTQFQPPQESLAQPLVIRQPHRHRLRKQPYSNKKQLPRHIDRSHPSSTPPPLLFSSLQQPVLPLKQSHTSPPPLIFFKNLPP